MCPNVAWQGPAALPPLRLPPRLRTEETEHKHKMHEREGERGKERAGRNRALVIAVPFQSPKAPDGRRSEKARASDGA